MASFNASLVHLPLVIKGLHLLTLLSFLVSFYPKHGGTFSLSWLGSFKESTLPPMKHIDHQDLDPLNPNLQ
jgi:hypothetical protein